MRELIKQKLFETKKSLVLEKVSEYFENEGFENAKMHDIAKNLGISVGALYKLFPSKEALFYEYISFQINNFYNELIKECSDIKEPREILQKFVELKFKTFLSKKKAIEDPVLSDPLFFLKMNIQKNNPAKPIYSFLEEVFLTLVAKESLKRVNPLKTAYIFNAYTMGYIEYWINCNSKLDDVPQEIVDRFIFSLKAG